MGQASDLKAHHNGTTAAGACSGEHVSFLTGSTKTPATDPLTRRTGIVVGREETRLVLTYLIEEDGSSSLFRADSGRVRLISASQATPARVAATGLRGKGRKVTPQQRDEILRRKNEGESVRRLALEYGISASTIHHY